MWDMNDVMEDALSEDSMMDCGGDGGDLEDLDDFDVDIRCISPDMRDIAGILVSLSNRNDEDNDDAVSSSEDEGVEVDIEDSENDDDGDDDDIIEDAMLLAQVKHMVTQQLKDCPHKWSLLSDILTSGVAHQNRSSTHSGEVLQNTDCLDRGCLQDQVDSKAATSVRQSDFFGHDDHDERNAANRTKSTNFSSLCQDHQVLHSRSFESKDTASHNFPSYMSLDRHLGVNDPEAAQSEKNFDPDSWAAGWDACTTEALRYLVEDEGLPLHHPTVVALKHDLNLQKERVLGYIRNAEAKSQDMSLVLD